MLSKAAFCTHFSQRSRGSWGIGFIGQRLPSRVHDPSRSFQDDVIHEQQWKSAKQGRDSSRVTLPSISGKIKLGGTVMQRTLAYTIGFSNIEEKKILLMKNASENLKNVMFYD